MEDLPAYEDREQGEELQPPLASFYQFYEADMLLQFVDAAEISRRGRRAHPLRRCSTFILLANPVEGPGNTRGYYDLAQAEYRMAQLLPSSVRRRDSCC